MLHPLRRRLGAVIVCHCKGVSDRTIRRAVRAGAVCGLDVGLACAAGTGCGGCREAIDEIVASELGETAAVFDLSTYLHPAS
jgi:bacterioferritin-associated ferredoxin